MPAPDPVRSRKVGIAVGLFLMVCSVAFTSTFLIIGGTLVFKNVKSMFWSRTTGKLIHADLKAVPGGNQTPTNPVVKYSFSINGQSYLSDKWSPAGNGINAEGKINAMKKTGNVTVYYNPSAPSDCALVLPSPHVGFLPFMLGLALFFILVIGISGGTLFAAMHPELASDPKCTARRIVATSIRLGVALGVSSLTGLGTLMLEMQGGWWQWGLSFVAAVLAIRSRK